MDIYRILAYHAQAEGNTEGNTEGHPHLQQITPSFATENTHICNSDDDKDHS